MDRGLQERLVGAAVLVALGVWLIPWVLDGVTTRDGALSEEVALKLPTPDVPDGRLVRRQTIDLSADRGGQFKASDDDAGDEAAAAARGDIESDTAADTAADTTAATAVAESVVPPVTPAAPPQSPEPVTAAADVPEPDTADEQEAVSAAAASGTIVRDIIAATPIAGWMVQLGSFSDAGNARRQAQRLGGYGHDAQIYEFASAGGRTMFRVRLGPHDTRAGAEAAASSLAAHGFVAQLVAPE